MDLDGGFAVPAESGGGGEVAFEDGAGVDIVSLGAAEVLHGEVEVFEFVFDEVVVVVVPGVSGDAVLGVGVLLAREVVEGEGDDGFAAREDFARVTAAIDVAFEPLHVAGVSLFDPVEVLVGVGGSGGGGESAVGEAELFGDEADVGFGGLGGHGWELKW